MPPYARPFFSSIASSPTKPPPLPPLTGPCASLGRVSACASTHPTGLITSSPPTPRVPPLQGTAISYLLGVATVVQSSPLTTLIKYITPSTALATLMCEEHFKYDTNDDDELARLAWLRVCGTSTVDALDERCVINNVLARRNLVVCEEAGAERLVVVDIDCAIVIRSGRGGGRGESRWTMFVFVSCRSDY